MLRALTLIFIVLKITNFINWSWWWVLSPIIIEVIISILIFTFPAFALWLKMVNK